MKDTKSKKLKKENAEKPVSLWGASFREVVEALMQTRRMPKNKDEKGGSDDDR